MAGEGDFVADLGLAGVDPGVGGVGQHFAPEEGVDAARLQQRNLLRVAPLRVGFILHHARPAADGGREQAAQRVDGRARLVELADDRRGAGVAAAPGQQGFDLLGRIGALRFNARQSQRPFDRHLPVAKGLVGEDLRLRRLLESQVGGGNALDIGRGQLAILLAQVLAQGAIPGGGVDELHAALPVGGFAVAQQPDVGGDAGVVEHVQRQGDDRLQPVILDDPAPDVALPLAGIAGEQRRTVVDLGDAAAQRRLVLHLRQQIGQEHQLAVRRAGDEAEVGVAAVADGETRVADVALAAHALQVSLPAFAIGRVREHEVELAPREAVLRQRGPQGEVIDRRPLALQQQVGLGDGIGFRVDLLAVEVDGDLLALGGRQFGQPLFGYGQHAARAARAVIDQVSVGLDLPGDGQKDEVGHQPHHVARGEVLAGLLVVLLVEAANQLLEQRAHGVVVQAGAADVAISPAQRFGAEVDRWVEELFDQAAQDVGVNQGGNLVAELELVEYLLHVGREAVEIGFEVGAQLVGLGPGAQVAQGEWRGVVEGLTGGGAQGGLRIGDARVVHLLLHALHGRFRRLQHGVEAADNGHGQDDVAVLAADVDVAQNVIGNAPDKVSDPVELGRIHPFAPEPAMPEPSRLYAAYLAARMTPRR